MIDALNRNLRRVPAITIYIVVAIWTAVTFWLGATGALGPDPVDALENAYGERALQLLIIGLAVTPLRKHLGLNLMKFRRAIGVSAFFLVLVHFAVWAVLDVQTLDRVWADIVKRPFITVGLIGLLLLTPLAVTSNNLSLRKLGAVQWRKLHKLTYPAVLAGAVHYVMLAKGFQIEPLVYLTTILFLLLLRMPRISVLRPSRKGDGSAT